MKHLGTQRLETERLVLRRFTMEDAQAMFENWASDPEVTKFLSWPTHQTIADSRSVLSEWTEQYQNDSFYEWAIVENETGEPVGSIGVVSSDLQVQKAHIGYCIGRRWWHRGITSEALQAVIGFLFDEVQVQRIDSQHDPRNPHSGDVMKKCGLRYEGTLRKSFWNNQGICDACYYSILSEERS
ncbi:N-acetyltransferase [Butyricicoccus sp. 1XD8-22]|nr:N-acetyltransferase [Butyricicoccus sp. 1XD8-22]